MAARVLEEADLIEIIGSSAVTAEIFQGRREISLAEAKVLGEFFHVDPRLLWQLAGVAIALNHTQAAS